MNTDPTVTLPTSQPPPLPSLPWAMRRIATPAGMVATYDSGSPGLKAPGTLPLLLVHSVNASASAFEMEPVMLRQSHHRRVVALDLPGFGASDRPDRPYTPAQMTAAIVGAIDAITERGSPQVDVLALSLGCEFAAQAVLERPGRVRSLALVSPTGMEDRRVGERYEPGKTRENRPLRWLLRNTFVGHAAYRLLTTDMVMRGFLARTWGSPHFDERLLQHGRRCAQQDGAQHAPLDFVAGALFTPGIIERYRALALPVWVAHGRKGGFTDFGACPESTGTAAGGGTFRLRRQAFDSGAMPHFELADRFDGSLCDFMDGLPMQPGMATAGPGRSRSTLDRRVWT